MTYSIIARCPRTGQLGIGIASYSIAVGLYCDGAVRPNVGATVTQGHPNPRNNRLALSLLAQGCNARHALRELAGSDPHFEYRQIGVVDREGTVAVHSGTRVRGWAGQRIGEGYAAMGETLAGQKVVDALAASFEMEPQAELEARLLKALEAGRDAGGLVGSTGRLHERSVALIVWDKLDYSDIDLRVDLHDKAVDELRRIYIDYKPTAAFYEERARRPHNAISAMEFADTLKKQREKEPS